MTTIRSRWPERLEIQLLRKSGSPPPVRTFSMIRSPAAVSSVARPLPNSVSVEARQLITWPTSAIMSGRNAAAEKFHQSVKSVTASCGSSSIVSLCWPITPTVRATSSR